MTGIEQSKALVTAVSEVASGLMLLKDMDLGALKGEMLNLDMAEKAELAQVFKDKFNLPSESLEENIEKGFDMLLTLAVIFGPILAK